MGWEVGYGREGFNDQNTSQYDLRTRWEVGNASTEFKRIFKANLLGFVGHIEKVFSPPQSAGLQFEFGPGMRDKFAQLIRDTAFPKEGPGTSGFAPDDPGFNDRDRWWRQAASGAAIGASFREEGTLTSVHVAFNDFDCDVHVDRNSFVVTEGGFTHWNPNAMLRHFAMDLMADKFPWLTASLTYVDKKNKPLLQATLSPWLTVDLPQRQDPADLFSDSFIRKGIKVGVMAVGQFGK